MQLQLEAAELNLLADILLEQVGRASAKEVPSQRETGIGLTSSSYEDLLNKILARDLRLDSGELEQAGELLGHRKRELKEEIARTPDPEVCVRLREKLGLVEHTLERVNEACVMF